MRARRIHADEIDVDARLVRRLLEDQHPHWAELPLGPVPSWGTDNALFRLGDDMVVRLPVHAASVHDLDREERWVPFVAFASPVEVPTRLASREPAHGYPFHWCVWRWIEGANAAAGRLVTAAWEAALRVPVWDRPPVWVHGDLTPGNLVYVDDRLVAVLDRGGVGIGDPACDLLPAWNLLPSAARPTFRDAVGVDDATWERGRGWALSTAVIALPYYLDTDPGMVAMAQRQLVELFGPEVLTRR